MRRLFGILEQVSDSDAKSPSEAKPSSLEEMERSYIFETLKRYQWNRTATAAEMGIHPTTLWRKMKRLNVEAPEKSGSVMM